MEQRLSLVTLGVADLGRARGFYEALGWRGQEVEGFVFFQAGGLALVLWGRDELARDAGVDDLVSGTAAVALAHNVRSTVEVDELMALAARSGAVVTRTPAATAYGGYAGWFRDPDGHLWEVAYNPAFPLAADGRLRVLDLGGD